MSVREVVEVGRNGEHTGWGTASGPPAPKDVNPLVPLLAVLQTLSISVREDVPQWRETPEVAMSVNRSPAVVFEPLTRGSWRLCDASVPPADAQHLLAYVERIGYRHFSVVWVSYRSGIQTFEEPDQILVAATNMVAGVRAPDGLLGSAGQR